MLGERLPGKDISNSPSVRLEHPVDLDCSDGSHKPGYPLTENYILPVAQGTGHIAYSPPLLCAWYTHHQSDTCVTLLAGAAVKLYPFTQLLVMCMHLFSR